MTHTEAFEAFRARRDEERREHVKVTWRRVSGDTGGGYSGLGPDGKLVFVKKSPSREMFDYGDVSGKVRTIRGTARTLTSAKTAAANLLSPGRG